MYKLNHLLSESLDRYYNTLKYSGYVKYNDVYKLIVATFIKDILDGEFGALISEEDYKNMERILNCFYGSNCLFPYPTYKQDTVISKEYMSDILSLSEDSNIRTAEDNTTRLVLL